MNAIRYSSVFSVLLLSCAQDKTIGTSNRAPDASFVQPLEDEAFDEGTVVEFIGVVGDDGPVEDLEVNWVSSIDGILPDFDPPDANGNVELSTASLSEGVHVINLQVIDRYALQGEDTVTIEILDVPEIPSIEILHPFSGEVGLENTPFVFMAEVSDRQEAAENLRVELVANPGGFICFLSIDGSGIGQCSGTLPLGSYTLTFTAEDSDENVAQAFAIYSVVSPLDYDGDGDGYTPNGGDCNDSNGTIYPGAPEICDGLDNDCNEITEIDHGSECYDDDGDGFCESPPCMNADSFELDCDDYNPAVYPGATEVVNAVDDNCEGRIDEGTVVYDDDGDGYCETPPCVNTTRLESDCNDDEFTVSPGQQEICDDGLDNDCDGSMNQQNAIGCTQFYLDMDSDGYGVFGSTECWCEDGSYPYTGVNSNDCYDSNADAYPYATGYFSFHRGDGSFDYDCNGAEEKEYTGISGGCNWAFQPFSCEANAFGWESVEPSCGNSGLWVDDCSANYNWFCLGLYGVVAGATGSASVILQAISACGSTCSADYSNSVNTQSCR